MLYLVAGALLSHFLAGPIYLSSVTVASDSTIFESCRLGQDTTDQPSAIWTDTEQGYGAPAWTPMGQSLTPFPSEEEGSIFEALKRAISSRLIPLGELLSLPYTVNEVGGGSYFILEVVNGLFLCLCYSRALILASITFRILESGTEF